jgi:hypothetical protein
MFFGPDLVALLEGLDLAELGIRERYRLKRR